MGYSLEIWRHQENANEYSLKSVHYLDATTGDWSEQENISAFFVRKHQSGIHIAVVCGADSPWDVETLKAKLAKTNNCDENLICRLDNDSPIHTRHLCVAIIQEDDGALEEIFKRFVAEFITCMEKLSQALEPDIGKIKYNDVERAKDAISTIIGQATAYRYMGIHALQNIGFTENFSCGLDTVCNTNGIPEIYLVAFLPGSVFHLFTDSQNNFFKQIELVIHIINSADIKINELTEKNTQLEEKNTQLEEKIKQNEEDKENTARKIIEDTLQIIEDSSDKNCALVAIKSLRQRYLHEEEKNGITLDMSKDLGAEVAQEKLPEESFNEETKNTDSDNDRPDHERGG